MKIHCHEISSRRPYGGTTIELDGNEVALAITTYIASLGIVMSGPRTVRINEEAEEFGHTPGSSIFVDPSGRVLADGDVLQPGTSVYVQVATSRCPFPK